MDWKQKYEEQQRLDEAKRKRNAEKRECVHCGEMALRRKGGDAVGIGEGGNNSCRFICDICWNRFAEAELERLERGKEYK